MMQKANSPDTATRKRLSPKLSGKCSASICQLENNVLIICSREHLFTWQAGIQQITSSFLVSGADSSAGDVKQTQKHHSRKLKLQKLWACMTVAVTCYRAGRSFLRKFLVVVHFRGGRLPRRTGPTGSVWCFWSNW